MAPVKCSTPVKPSMSMGVLEKSLENPVKKETTIDDPKENDPITFICLQCQQSMACFRRYKVTSV